MVAHPEAQAVTTYEQVHAGDVVLGGDGEAWGVAWTYRGQDGRLAITLTRHGRRVTGYPPPGTEVTVIEPADVRAEGWAFGVLAEAFGDIELIGEVIVS